MSTATQDTSRRTRRVAVQKFGSFLSNMVVPNIAAFIAWGLITALFIEAGWLTGIFESLQDPGGWVAEIGGWGDYAGGGIVGPMITYLLPLLIGYTGGRMAYDDNLRGGVVGAIATIGAVAGADVPMFLGAMIMGPLGGFTMKKLDALWSHRIRPGFELLVNNFSAGIWGMLLALVGFFAAGPFVGAFSEAAGNVVDFLVDSNLLPLTSLLIEPAKVLFLNNAINQGILTPLGTAEATEAGKSILFLLEANPAAGAGLLLAFMIFGKGGAKASAPGAFIIHFFGGIQEIYFPYVLMKPKLILAMIAGGMTQIFINLVFDAGLRAPAAPGSIIAIYLQTASDSYLGVTLSVLGGATVTFVVAALLLKTERSADDGDLAGATASMEAMKGKKSSVAAALGGHAGDRAPRPIRSIVFACDAGVGSSAMGASVLRRRIHAAGHHEVTVANKAISSLTDTADLVVSHQELTSRARQKTPSAVHVSVDNFLDSPRYGEIVELVEQNAGAASTGATPDTDGSSDPVVAGGVLTEPAIVLRGTATTRDAAISEAGELLVEVGAADAAYVASMHTRERSVSTHMGSLLAIPHGTNEAKAMVERTAISFVRYPETVDWNGKPVEFVIGIASTGDDHLALLARIAEVFVDTDQVERLREARTPAEVIAVLESVSV